MTTIKALPAWLNKGEAGLADWIDLSEDHRKFEDKSTDRFITFGEDSAETLGYSPETKILKAGEDFKRITEFGKKSPSDQKKILDAHTKGTIDKYSSDVSHSGLSGLDGYMIIKKKEYEAMIKKMGRPVSTLPGIDEDIDPVLKEHEVHDSMTEATDVWAGDWGHFDWGSSSEDVTYEKVLEWIADPGTSASAKLGFSSDKEFYKAFINKTFDWQPHANIDEYNLPGIEGNEDHFKPLLEDIKTDDTLRQRADRLHNLVYKPSTTEYFDRYHLAASDSTKYASDSSSNLELYDDYELPYASHLHRVKFNSQIHSQMDFGVMETV